MKHFHTKYQKHSVTGCWEWQRYRKPNGYGYTEYWDKAAKKRVNTHAHRLSWIIHNGPIPPGMQVCHTCDNPPCVNPAHLFLGTNYENWEDCVSKGRNMGGANGPPIARPRARLTEADVAEIRRLRASGASRDEVARRFGISVDNVSHVTTGRRWKNLP